MPINKNNTTLVVLIGIILGTLSFFSPVSFAMIIITLLAYAILSNLKYPRQEKVFLVKLFIWGWTIRMVICLVIYVISARYGGEGSLFQDDVSWPRTAWLMYQSGLGKFDFAGFNLEATAGGHPANEKEHYLILISLLFSVFRYYTPLVAKYINIICSCLTAIIIYDLGRQIFNRDTAKISSILTMFTPSLAVWSVVALKDSSFIFLVVLCLWAAVKFFKNKKRYFILLLILSLFSIYSIRSHFLPLILIIIGVFLTVAWRVNLFKKIGFLFVVGVVICMVLISPIGQAWQRTKVVSRLSELNNVHIGFVTTGGAIYKLFDDRFYEGTYSVQDMGIKDILKWYIKGTAYFTFVPMPWSITTKRQLMFMPQIMAWYILFPFVLIGIICSLRYRARDIFPIVFFLFLVTSAYGLTEGNIGIAVRHRDVLTPFCLVFAAVGLRKAFGYQFLQSEES